MTPAEKILGALAFAAACFLSGAWVSYQWIDGRTAKAERAKLTAALTETQRLADLSRDIGQGLAAEAAGRAEDRAQFNRRLRDARGPLITCPTTTDPVLSAEFVGLWNDALHFGSAGHPGRVDARSAATGGFATPQDALDNAAENSDRWATCRARLKAWQQLAIDSCLIPGGPKCPNP